jgi:hypothetical protein
VQIHHKPTKILIVGRSGSGKSTYEIRFVSAAKYDRIFIYDHKMEFAIRLGVETCFNVDDLNKALEEDRRVIAYNNTEDFPGDSTAGFEFFCEWVFEVAKVMQVKSLFVADEINRFTTTSEMGWEFRQLIEDGRLQGLDFIGTAHAGNQISNRLKLQLTEIVALNSRDKRPLEFLDEAGFDIEEITKLEVGQFVTLMLETGVFTRGRLFAGKTPETPPPDGNDRQIPENNDCPDDNPGTDDDTSSDSPSPPQP